MRPLILRTTLAVAAACLLASAYSRLSSPAAMTQTANALLASLSDEQKAKATFDFSSDERLNWHFIPRVRKGLPLKEMTQEQRHLAQALLSSGLSQQGYVKAVSIMSLEEVLRILEAGKGTNVRDPENYFFSIFGAPSETGTWGFRVEGHHMAQNWTIAKGKASAGPSFYGTNPAEVRQGPRKGLRVLGQEEDKARALLMALTPAQRKEAIVTETAYKDIFTMASRKAALTGQPNGLSISKLNAAQKKLLHDVLDEYAYNVPDEIAQHRLDLIKKSGSQINFAWAGVAERGGPHYYRVQGQGFLVEHDNTQNDSNHVHSVWRDIEGDFGMDLLGDHLKSSHGAK